MTESKANDNRNNQVKPGKNKFRWFCLCSQVDVEQCIQPQFKLRECGKRRRLGRSLTTGAVVFSSETSAKLRDSNPRQQKLEDDAQTKSRTVSRRVSASHSQISKLTQEMVENGLIPNFRETTTLTINSTDFSSFSNSIGYGSALEYSSLEEIVE